MLCIPKPNLTAGRTRPAACSIQGLPFKDHPMRRPSHAPAEVTPQHRRHARSLPIRSQCRAAPSTGRVQSSVLGMGMQAEAAPRGAPDDGATEQARSLDSSVAVWGCLLPKQSRMVDSYKQGRSVTGMGGRPWGPAASPQQQPTGRASTCRARRRGDHGLAVTPRHDPDRRRRRP